MRKRIRQARADIATMRRLFAEAERLARTARRTEPGVEHLVLAALELPDGTARAALGDVGVEPADLRRALAEVADPSGHAASAAEPPMDLAFHRAVGNAKAAGTSVRSGDVLLAAIDPGEGAVARALVVLGVPRDVLGAAIHRRLET